MSIKILDCTLRDGGYINHWGFSNEQILKTVDALIEANVDIIECGYLNDKSGKDTHSTLFPSVAKISAFLKDNSNKVAMINLGDFDVDILPKKDENSINGIRLAFHQKDIDEAVVQAEKIIALGYQLYFQPMVTKNYTDAEFLTLITRANTLDIYAFYIVDSFGSMTLQEFERYVVLAHNNLNAVTALGYHSHNNMQLAFSNAIAFCVRNIAREIIIDSSIYGMGRGAGNLNTELIVDYLNTQKEVDKYSVTPLLKIIDEILVFYFNKKSWGFSLVQYLSASLDCHPNYASHLVNKKTNNIASIRGVLRNIPAINKASFDVSIVDGLYQEFLLSNKAKVCGLLQIPKDKKILLIASGNSVNDNFTIIQDKSKSGDYLLIALNHKPALECDYYFFSNQQRFDEFSDKISLDKQITTSGIACKNQINTVIDLKSIAYIEEVFVSNVALLLLNYLAQQKVKSVEVAGLDGYQKGKNNYAYDETNVVTNEDIFNELNKAVANALRHLMQVVNIELITPSLYAKEMPIKIMGIIPARYDSSRFAGKPLCLINNVAMIKRTYEQAKQSNLLDKLVVATDSIKIQQYCEQEQIPVVMTSDKHLTGTDRLAEVAQKEYFDFYINIQGDEPVIDHKSINQIVTDFKKYGTAYEVYSLYKKINDQEEVVSDTIIKVVVNQSDELIYMSRHPIPFNKSNNVVSYNKQICVYGFTKKALNVFTNIDKTHNEQFEDIELLRFLDLGYSVKLLETTVDSIAVDVPSDVQKVENFLNERNLP